MHLGMTYIEDGGQTVATHNAAAIVYAYAGECVCAYDVLRRTCIRVCARGTRH